MDEEDDIFSNINEFCKDNKLDEDYVKTTRFIPTSIIPKDTLEPLNTFDASVPSSLTTVAVEASTSKKSNRKGRKKKTDTPVVPCTSTTSTTTSSSNVSPGSSNTNQINSLPQPIASRTRGRKKKQSNKSDPTSTITSSATNLNNLNTTNQPQQNISLLQQVLETLNSRRMSKSNRSRSKSSGRRASRRGRNQINPNSVPALPPPPQTMLTQRQLNRHIYRNFVGERAARAEVVDHIDLVSSPCFVQPTKEPINLDSDNEEEVNKSVTDSSFDNIDEIEKTPLRVKVKWGKKIESFPYRKYQKFSDIIKHFADLEKVNKENICLNLEDRIICEDDTPDSINYEVHMFIHGRTVKEQIKIDKNTKDPNLIEIKIQCESKKQPIIMSIKKSNTFSILYKKCAEEFQVSESNIKLSFDGDLLVPSDKPEEFDFEGGEIIDCRIQS